MCRCPKTYKSLQEVKVALDRKELDFPVIIKPRWGMGSIGIFIAEDETELLNHIQECEHCRKEYEKIMQVAAGYIIYLKDSKLYITDEKKYVCFYSYFFFISMYKTLFFFEHFEHKTIFP